MTHFSDKLCNGKTNVCENMERSDESIEMVYEEERTKSVRSTVRSIYSGSLNSHSGVKPHLSRPHSSYKLRTVCC